MSTIGHNGGPEIDWRDYGGYIVEARNSRTHPIVGYGQPVEPADSSRGAYSINEAWRDLQHECRYLNGCVMNGARKMEIRRGELVGAISYLAKRWNWTPKKVRVFVDKLEADGMINRFERGPDGAERRLQKGNRNGNHAAIIRVCNYDKFNGFPGQQRQSQGQSSGNQGAIERQSRGKKQNKGTREKGK